MKASVLHDREGRILAISKAADLTASGSKFTQAGMVAGEGQSLVVVELSAEDSQRPLRELHETYRVDPATKNLVQL
ncbi:MAG: hypothetical protein ABSA02_35560 [Trebonia sp.]|jgi:hypothetical protein